MIPTIHTSTSCSVLPKVTSIPYRGRLLSLLDLTLLGQSSGLSRFIHSYELTNNISMVSPEHFHNSYRSIFGHDSVRFCSSSSQSNRQQYDAILYMFVQTKDLDQSSAKQLSRSRSTYLFSDNSIWPAAGDQFYLIDILCTNAQ
jgi:hypothetical protein